MTTPVRLQRYLAAAGVAARRKAEDLITAGRVTVNGEVVTTLGTKVDPDRDEVTVDGEAVVPLDKFYVLFNKPKACITAVSDDRDRLTVMDYLPNLPVPVKPVGRLDFYTEGVLLLTNDGELAAKLLAPSSHVPKTYHVKVHGHVRPEHIKQLRNGVELDDGTTTLPAEVEVLPAESKHTWLAITIHEGKHRQIHRMVEALGYYVDKLQRVAFANLTFHHLRVGDARELAQQELNELRDLVGLDHSAVARGKWRTEREDTDIPRRARLKAFAEAAEAADERAAAAAARAAGGSSSMRGDGDGDGDGDEHVHDAGADDREDTWDWQDSATAHVSDDDESADERRGAGGGRGGRDRSERSGASARRESAGRGAGRGAVGGRGAGGAGGARGERGGFGGRDARGGARGGSREERGRGGFGGRDARGTGGPRGGAARDERGGRGGFGGRDARGGGPRGASRDERGSRGGFGDRDARSPGGPRSASRDERGSRGGARPETSAKRGGQGRTFGKRVGPPAGRRGSRR
jgi:23S rRNA pseudouridine2605 synthase